MPRPQSQGSACPKKIVRKFGVVDNTLLHALDKIAWALTKGTKATLKATEHVLNYIIASNPKPCIWYQASNMILQVDSGAA